MLTYLNTITGVMNDGIVTFDGSIQNLNYIENISKLVLFTSRDKSVGSSTANMIDVFFYNEKDENDSPIPLTGLSFPTGNNANARGVCIEMYNTTGLNNEDSSEFVLGKMTFNCYLGDERTIYSNYDNDIMSSFIADNIYITIPSTSTDLELYIYYE